jgi:hypothetical protein
MVVLNKIYTCTGDDGTTALGTGFDLQRAHNLKVVRPLSLVVPLADIQRDRPQKWPKSLGICADRVILRGVIKCFSNCGSCQN